MKPLLVAVMIIMIIISLQHSYRVHELWMFMFSEATKLTEKELDIIYIHTLSIWFDQYLCLCANIHLYNNQSSLSSKRPLYQRFTSALSLIIPCINCMAPSHPPVMHTAKHNKPNPDNTVWKGQEACIRVAVLIMILRYINFSWL